jgi:hypothetical protein
MPRKAGRGQPRVPPPDTEFAKCSPSLVASYQLRWYRLAAIARPSLFDWDDRAVSRFSHPRQPYKILYLADEKETAFWEVFGGNIEDMPVDNRALMKKNQIETRGWVSFEIPAALRLINVTDEDTIHALRSNASTWLAPYKHCQAWGRALMNHPMNFDGFIYQSCRRGPTARCLALFSRPNEITMEHLLLARTETGRPSLIKDPDFLELLIEHNIDMR